MNPMMEPILPHQEIVTASLDINALLELSRLLIESDDPHFIFNNLLLTLMGKFGLGRAAVAVADGNDPHLFHVTITKGGGNSSELAGGELRQSTTAESNAESNGAIGFTPETEAMLERNHIQYQLPIQFGERTFGIVLLGKPLINRNLTHDDLTYAALVRTIAAIALEGCNARGSLRHANRKLERRVHRLRSLFEASQEFNALLDHDGILRLLGYTLMGEMAISKYAVALNVGPQYRFAVNRFPEAPSAECLAPLAEHGAMMLGPESATDTRFAELYRLGIRASIPMEMQGEARGLLLIGQRLSQAMDEEDLEYLAALGSLAIGGLETARLLQEMIEKNRLEEDLRIAAEIQQGLLPLVLPTVPGYQVAARTIPTQQVGGDCYDAIELGEGRVLVSVADVSGKGTPASLLMANFQAALRALAGLKLPLSELVARVNDIINGNTSADKFITAFFGILDPNSGGFSYVNAGHNPPYHFHQNGADPLDVGGLILGVMPTLIPYQVGEITMQPGDMVILYTDGVTEAMSKQREEYGDDRLKALFADFSTTTAHQAVERARYDITLHTRGAAQSDDITLLVVKRDSNPTEPSQQFG